MENKDTLEAKTGNWMIKRYEDRIIIQHAIRAGNQIDSLEFGVDEVGALSVAFQTLLSHLEM